MTAPTHRLATHDAALAADYAVADYYVPVARPPIKSRPARRLRTPWQEIDPLIQRILLERAQGQLVITPDVAAQAEVARLATENAQLRAEAATLVAQVAALVAALAPGARPAEVPALWQATRVARAAQTRLSA